MSEDHLIEGYQDIDRTCVTTEVVMWTWLDCMFVPGGARLFVN